MTSNIENIAGLVGNLNIVDGAPQDREQKAVSIQDAIHLIIQSANTIASQVQTVKPLADHARSSSEMTVTDAFILYEGIKKLTNITSDLRSTIDALNEATERSVIMRLESLGSPNAPIVPKMLLHFDPQMREIVRKFLDMTSNEEVLWKVAEECYNQATSSSGTLNAEHYFIPLEEALLEWPYDPDYQSAEYYEHENRREVDENYAKAFEKREELRLEARRKKTQSWPEFWIRVLNRVPGGPTLFYSAASFDGQHSNLGTTPRYLFRTFDAESSGINNENIIASVAREYGPKEKTRTDILTLERDKAAELLHAHLTKDLFSGVQSDNLMSWTSSLPFAIQYAIWRIEKGGHRPCDVDICAVDTGNFPRGQFAQDVSLIKVCHGTSEGRNSREREAFFNFRLKREDFYNGEYLSQGSVNHRGRSCVVSLEKMIEAGLFQLYPEFEDAVGREQWTKRVRKLRQSWSCEQQTTDRDIELALKVGRECFTQFEQCDIASLLLMFKNRKFSDSKLFDFYNEHVPEWTDKPVEVRRYWTVAQSITSHDERLTPHGKIRYILQ